MSQPLTSPLPHSYYQQDARLLARDLLGKTLVRRLSGQLFRGRIVETEAYMGPLDLAAHSSKGRTARTEIMFGPAGHAYVYFIYGIHWMFNIVAGELGDGQAVLVRAAEPLEGWNINLTGPARLAKGFQITRAQNGLDLTGPDLFLEDPGLPPPRIERSPRIGVDYAGKWRNALLRFYDEDSRAVSGPRTFPGL